LVLEQIRSEQSMLEAMLVMTPDQILSTVRQLVVFLWEAQKAVRFVHNDLHLNNVLMTKTSMKYFSLGSRKFPTHGLSPVIIDFGFSHFDRWRLHPVLSQCTQTHRGMNPFVFNEKFDFLTLLHGVRKDCGFDRNLKNAITRMLEQVGEDKFYKNARWQKMFYSLFDLMILMCEFPTTAPGSLETIEDDDSDRRDWKTVNVESEKLVQENLLFQVIGKIDPESAGSIVDFPGEWTSYRRTGEASDELVAGLEFVFARFLGHFSADDRKPMSQKNIEKLLDSSATVS